MLIFSTDDSTGRPHVLTGPGKAPTVSRFRLFMQENEENIFLFYQKPAHQK